MDFFDTDKIEGKERLVIDDKNVGEVMSSRLMDHKLQALEYLNGKNALKHFNLLLAAANYPIRQVSEQAYNIFLKMLPAKRNNPELNPLCMELLVTKIMPWVNDLASKTTPGELDMDNEDYEETVYLLNHSVCECLDYCSVALDTESLNEQLQTALKYPNFKVQVAGCQVVKHFYLNVQEKRLLELSSLFDILIANSTVGTKELKKHSLEAMMAIYRVFGESVDEFISKISNPDKIQAIKNGAAQLRLKEVRVPTTQPAQKKSLMPNRTSSRQIPSSERGIGHAPFAARQVQSIMPNSGAQQSYDFDEYQDEPASEVLLAYDAKWVKKIQIITKDEQLLDELATLVEVLESQTKLAYFSDVNKNFLLLLKNLLMSTNKKVVSLVISAISILLRSTARNLQDGFMMFYSEIIEKLRSKSKQDNELYDSLIYLSSNVTLANFLRRIQKEFQEKSSVLRLNLIEVLHKALFQKSNYSDNDLIKAGNALTELKRFAETELTKDLNVQVRQNSTKLSNVIQDMYSEYLNETQGETGARKSFVGVSVGRKSHVNATQDSAKVPDKRQSVKAKLQSGSNMAESIIVPQRAHATITPGNLPPMHPSNFHQSTMPTGNVNNRLSMMRGRRKENQNDRNSEKSEERSSFKSISGMHRDSSSKGLSNLISISEDTDFLTAMEIIEKMNLARKDQIDKQKLTSAFQQTTFKMLKEPDVDRLIAQLVRVKDELGPSNLVSILKIVYESMEYFSPSALRSLLPAILRFSEMQLKGNDSPVAKRKAPNAKFDIMETEAIIVIDYFLEFYGPMYFFEVFEETLYTKELFQSKEAEPILSLFQGVLVKIPANLHPVSLILSIIRGFIYLHSSQNVWARLNELVYVVCNVYGKDNFRYMRKEFDIVGLKEKVVDIGEWQLITKFKNSEALEKLASMSFNQKMISAAKDISPVVKSTLSSQVGKGPLHLVRELLQLFTRNFIYVLGDKENVKLMDFIVSHMVDANLQLQKLALQVFVLHFNSAKTTFKFEPMFYSNFGASLRNSNAEQRSLAINICFYVAKQELKVYKMLIADVAEASDDVKEDLTNLIIRLMKSDQKFIKSFELSTGLEQILYLLISKKQYLRELGEKVIERLLTHFERKDFVAQINSHKISFRKQMMEIVDGIIQKMQSGEICLSPAKSAACNLPVRREPKEFIIKNINQISNEVAKCKTIKELKVHAENHLALDISSKLFDVNTKNVLSAISKLKDAITENQMLAVKSMVFLFKLMNLLIAAETKQNEISQQMADMLVVLTKSRKNTSTDLYKQEKWAVCEFLFTLYKTKFEKKYIKDCVKLVLSLFSRPEDKEAFFELVEKCNPELFAEYVASLRRGQDTDASVAETNYLSQMGFQADEQRQPSSLAPMQRQRLRNMSHVDSRELFTSPMVDIGEGEGEEEEYLQDDPNFADLKHAMADQSSIKYDFFESPGKDLEELPNLILPAIPKKTGEKGLMSSSSSQKSEIKTNHQDFDERASPVFAIQSPMHYENQLDSPMFGKSPTDSNYQEGVKQQKQFMLVPQAAPDQEKSSNKEKKNPRLPPLGSPSTANALNEQVKKTKRPVLKTSTSKADFNIKKASTGDQHRSYDSAGVRKLNHDGSKTSLSKYSRL